MNIIVLGGSPKGEASITMQYVKYMQKHLKNHNFSIIQTAAPIKRLEKNRDAFLKVIEQVKKADAVIWAFPLYYWLVCSQYKRFIELIFERKATAAFKGKYTASLSTSIHFYDHTAHNYIRSICEDLGMNYIGFFSAKMRDLFSDQGRTKFQAFSHFFINAVQERIETPRYSLPLPAVTFHYKPQAETQQKVAVHKKITLVTDSTEGNIGRMIERFKDCLAEPVHVVDLSKINIMGGCLGCLKCSNNNVCAYTGKDDYIEMFNSSIKPADILIFAGSIKDRYLSSRWKMFFDRSFFNTHQLVLGNKQVGILISGPLRYVPNLTEILQGYFQIHGSHVIDIITDESHDSKRIDSLIRGLALRLDSSAELKYIQPFTFLGAAGIKIFRDEMWTGLRVVFRADHKFFKKHKLYDFPQRNPLKNMFYRIGYFITGIPFIRRQMEQHMKNGMIRPFQRILTEKN
ncbi:MAG: NAD(P)H-dependent oxidoreductase [Spirochaetales bacterium]|nr:NAD(P)H-dependent oxidoreductase [Spirochaetales bacterium]